MLSCSLDSYCYICLRYIPQFFGSKYRIFWSKMETVDRIQDIEHAGVRGCLTALEVEEGVEVNHAGDLPARSGLGSSSAFTVGMLNALYTLRGITISKSALADKAIYVEQEVLRETVGVQDQIECAYGGFNHIQIARGGRYQVDTLPYHPELEENLMLFFTGIQRYASEIADAQVGNVGERQEPLEKIASLVPEALSLLRKGSIDEFGELLGHSWWLKKQLSDKITNDVLDDIYFKAINAGALGGKLLGAGGGGFFLFYARKEAQHKVRWALSDLIEIPFKFGRHGSELVTWK